MQHCSCTQPHTRTGGTAFHAWLALEWSHQNIHATGWPKCIAHAWFPPQANDVIFCELALSSLTQNFNFKPCRKLLISQKLHDGPSENLYHIWIGPSWICIASFMFIEHQPGHSQNWMHNLFIVRMISKQIHILRVFPSNYIFFSWLSGSLKTR